MKLAETTKPFIVLLSITEDAILLSNTFFNPYALYRYTWEVFRYYFRCRATVTPRCGDPHWLVAPVPVKFLNIIHSKPSGGFHLEGR